MGKRDDKRLADFCARFGYNPNKKKETPQKIVNLETCKFEPGTKILEVGGGLIAEITVIDEWKGIGVIPLNRGEQSKGNILYSSETDFENRIKEGYLQLL
jgi:hypothetical protein